MGHAMVNYVGVFQLDICTDMHDFGNALRMDYCPILVLNLSVVSFTFSLIFVQLRITKELTDRAKVLVYLVCAAVLDCCFIYNSRPYDRKLCRLLLNTTWILVRFYGLRLKHCLRN